jgi:hypothetical protein
MPTFLIYSRNSRRLRPLSHYDVNHRSRRPVLARTPPTSYSLKDEGDGAFERSRAAAQAKLDSIVEETRSQRSSERLVEKLYEIKTGENIKSVKLADLSAEWAKIARKRTPDERYASQCQSRIKQFVAFVQGQNGKAEEIAHVTRTMARAFLAAEETRGVTAKTWNDNAVVRVEIDWHAGGMRPRLGIWMIIKHRLGIRMIDRCPLSIV